MADKSQRKTKEKSYLLSNIRYVTRLLWNNNKWLIIFPVIGMPLTVAASTLLAYLPKVVIDKLEANTPVMKIVPVVVLFILALMLIASISSLIQSRQSVMRMESSQYYIKDMQKKFNNSHYTKIEDRSVCANFVNIHDMMFCGASSVFERFLSYCIQLISVLLGLSAYAVIMASVSPVLIIIIIVSNVLFYIIRTKRNKFTAKTRDRMYMVKSKSGYVISSVGDIKAAKDVKMLNMQKWLNHLLDSVQSQVMGLLKKVSGYTFMTEILNALVTLAREGAMYGILVYLFAAGKIGAGDFALSVALVADFSSWLNQIVGVLTDIKNYNVWVGRYKKLMSDLDSDKGAAVVSVDENTMTAPVEIELENVSFKYPSAENYTLKNISLKINSGEKLALVGINGSGKTTLVKLLCGFYRPTEGVIRVNGHDINDYSLDEYYRLFSIVFQDVNLMPIAVDEFISCEISKDNMNREKLDSVIAFSGLDSKLASLKNGVNTRLMKGIYEDGEEFSGGEHQRLVLARAVYRDSPCIILDEPTSALDPIAERGLYEKYNDLTKGKTSVYISHRLASTLFCDKIILLEDGRITESGTHGELMRLDGKYAYMYNIQSHYYRDDDEQKGEELISGGI